MAKEIGRYDSSLQMFVEPVRDVSISRLTFLRWLAEKGRLEHPIQGPSSGDFDKIVRREAIMHSIPAVSAGTPKLGPGYSGKA